MMALCSTASLPTVFMSIYIRIMRMHNLIQLCMYTYNVVIILSLFSFSVNSRSFVSVTGVATTLAPHFFLLLYFFHVFHYLSIFFNMSFVFSLLSQCFNSEQSRWFLEKSKWRCNSYIIYTLGWIRWRSRRNKERESELAILFILVSFGQLVTIENEGG